MFNVVLFADVRAIVEYIYSDEYCVFFGVFMLYLFLFIMICIRSFVLLFALFSALTNAALVMF